MKIVKKMQDKWCKGVRDEVGVAPVLSGSPGYSTHLVALSTAHCACSCAGSVYGQSPVGISWIFSELCPGLPRTALTACDSPCHTNHTPKPHHGEPPRIHNVFFSVLLIVVLRASVLVSAPRCTSVTWPLAPSRYLARLDQGNGVNL